jgi:hypothetical protein
VAFRKNVAKQDATALFTFAFCAEFDNWGGNL